MSKLAKRALCVQQLSSQPAVLNPASRHVRGCAARKHHQYCTACVWCPDPLCVFCTGLRWSERHSYCRYIPDSSQWPPVDPTQQFVDFTCIFPISQCYLTLILQVWGLCVGGVWAYVCVCALCCLCACAARH